jgi:ElaB/YqjD/DUF883 family membrane-anchored ribosome-binding protein
MAQFDTPSYAARGRTDTTAATGANPSLRERALDSVADVKASGREAVDAFTDVADSFGDAIEESIRTRPYATLAVAAGIGFLFGCAWSR